MAKTSPNDIVQFEGKNVRRAYARLLTMAQEAGIPIQLNSAHRSIKDQWRLFRQNMRLTSRGWVPKPGRPLTAKPGSSTHNKKGWQQGLDIDNVHNGTERFRKWAAGKGIIFTYTVPGESWHLNAAQDYDHKIYVLWHNRLDRIERERRNRQRKRRQ